jgi:hypothetical protein
MESERRHSNGRGLLAFDGASRASILSGDAAHTLLTMSNVLRRDRPGRLGQDYFTCFSNPYNVTRTLLLSIADILSELFFSPPSPPRNPRSIPILAQRFVKVSRGRCWAWVVATL